MQTRKDYLLGHLSALSAYLIWGVLPIYWKQLDHVPAREILSHRVLWGFVLLLLFNIFSRRKDYFRLLKDRKTRQRVYITSALIATNWLIFIFAVVSGHIVDASLGYFINPLVNILLGILFLRERLRPWQVLAVFFAAAGTLNLTVNYGSLPWISLTLAFSFGFYGLIRKTVLIESVNGLFIETSLLFPFAVGYLFYLGVKGAGAFGGLDWHTTTLLFLAGLVTSLPLVWFTSAARRLQFTTIGTVQYISPSLQFILAVLYYREPFDSATLITFAFIWIGLAIFIADSFSLQRRNSIRR